MKIGLRHEFFSLVLEASYPSRRHSANEPPLGDSDSDRRGISRENARCEEESHN